MTRTTYALLVGASALTMTTCAMAADVPEPMAPIVEAPAADPSIYVQLLGGGIAALDAHYYEGGVLINTYATEPGFAVAATLGVVVMDGLSLEADVMYSKRSYADPYPDDTTESLSFMGNVKYTIPVSDQFAIYGAVGLGHITFGEYATSVDRTDYFPGLGYQLILGAAMDLTENAALVAEVRYQDTFSPLGWVEDDFQSMDVPKLSLLAGVKLGF